MTSSNHGGPVLMESFSQFYQELAKIKLYAGEGRLLSYLDPGSDADQSPAALATLVRVRLHNLLSEQGRRVQQQCTVQEKKVYRVAVYVMTALADDLLIFDLDWSGRKIWPECLLEYEVFGTAMAGRNVFVHLDRLLSGHVHGPLQEDLCAVFLMALQLGFQGRYRGGSGQPILAAYRSKLLEQLSSRGKAVDRPICAQAYRYFKSRPVGPRLAPMGPWYAMAAGAGVFFLFLSSLIWLIGTSRLQTVLGT